MTKDEVKKVGIFVGTDVSAHIVLNRIVPEMIDLGFTPVIFMPKHKTYGNQNALQADIRKSAYLERDILKEVIYPYLNGHSERGKPIDPVKLAKRHSIKIFEVDDINAPDFQERQRVAKNYIGALSIRCFQIFKQPQISYWREKGFLLNLHPGILPNYRGVMSVARAMANPEQKNYGWTLHHIDEGIDTGEIISAAAIPIDRNKTVLTATLDMVDKGVRHIARLFQDMADGEAPLQGFSANQPENSQEENYFSYPSPEELASMKNAGIRLFDVNETINRYVEIFSDPRTSHGEGLKRAMKEAVEKKWMEIEAANDIGANTNVAVSPKRRENTKARINNPALAIR